MNKIIIFESKTDSLRTFARLMAEGFEEAGYQVLLADMQREAQAREEQEHAMKILKYLQDNDVKVELGAIAAPGADFADNKAPLTAALKHEQYVTSLIHAIYKQARDSDDFRACQFLEWFIAEQGEEEKSTADLIAKFDLFGGDAKGLYLLNAELKNRA